MTAPPAIPDLREAVARAGFDAWYCSPAYGDFPEVHGMWDRVAAAILAGPIASEHARLTERAEKAEAERDAARKEAAYLSSDRDDAREGERRWALRCGTVLGATPAQDAPSEPGRLGFVAISGQHEQSAWDDLTPEARQSWGYVEGAYLMRAEAELTTLKAAAARDAEVKNALAGLLPGKLCGESWGLPDTDTVQIVVTFGALRRARAILTSPENADV